MVGLEKNVIDVEGRFKKIKLTVEELIIVLFAKEKHNYFSKKVAYGEMLLGQKMGGCH